jgi:hypothetical protein
MLLQHLTPDQWSALGTVVSAVVAVLNLIVVVILLVFTRNATKAAQAQAAVAMRTLAELEEDKRRENGRMLRHAEAQLQDVGEKLLLLRSATRSVHFAAEHWRVRPEDWHEVSGAIIFFWPEGIPQAMEFDKKLREIDLDLQALAHVPVSNESRHEGLEHICKLVDEAHPLMGEIWDGLIRSVI